MIAPNLTYAPIQAIVDELARCGVTHAVTSPGSRNAPILLTLAAEARLTTTSVLDERSAGFMALGIARASGRPVVVTCTSGSAVANLMPAVVEANESRVPLILLTADRPPELRGVGAGQAIDQLEIFGSAAKWFVEVGNHPPGRATAEHFRSLACRAFATATVTPSGVVHLNLGLRDPLAPVEESYGETDWEGRIDGRPWTTVETAVATADAELLDRLARRISAARSGAIVVGTTRERLGPETVALASATGWPVLAEPTSGVRCGAHDRSRVVAHYDVLLRAPAFADRTRPDLVVRVGDTPTSKPLRAWLRSVAEQIVIDPDLSWHEPTRRADTLVAAPAAPLLAALASTLGPRDEAGASAGWTDADAVAAAALAHGHDFFEGAACLALADALSDDDVLWVSSSMPIRDVESFFPSTPTEVRFLANRGANGIDGVVSSAAGAALVTTGRCVLLTGELALLHDLSGIVAARRARIDLTIVCVNNGGGGIFDALPIAHAADPELYEEQIATPHPIELSAVAALGGMEHRVARSAPELGDALREGAGLIELPVGRRDGIESRRGLIDRVTSALA